LRFQGRVGAGAERGRERVENDSKKIISMLRNSFLNEKELASKETRLSSKWQGLVVVLTSRCNIECKMCNWQALKMDLPRKQKKEIIGLMPYLKKVIWSGGEVFNV